MINEILIFIFVITSALFLAYIIGSYMARLIQNQSVHVETRYGKWEKTLYSILKIDIEQKMNWKEYFLALMIVNLIGIIMIFLILIFQGFLPLNPDHFNGLSIDLALNTSVSFMTNTNLQHYTGETQLSMLAQLLALGVPMFVAPASGIAACFAFIRALVNTDSNIGNYYIDLTRIILTILLPVSIAFSIFFIILGIPETLNAFTVIKTLEGQVQQLVTGPLASWEAIKHLGQNGGGFFGANSAYPFENPNGITNILEIILMLIIPFAFPIAFGKLVTGNKGLALSIMIFTGYFAILFLSLIGTLGITGIETRFFGFSTTLFQATSISTNTGSTNASLYGMNPAAVVALLCAMFIQSVPGGSGVGFMMLIVYIILTLFIVGLIAGKTPEFIGYHITPKEVKLSVVIFLMHPLLIFIPTIIALITGQAQLLPTVGSPITASGYTQIIYEFTSAAANNGSDYLGAAANTPFWNVSTAIVMFIGRYVWIGLMLAIAGAYAEKFRKQAAEPIKIDTPAFIVTVIVIVFVLTAITYLPFLILGPLIM